MQSGNYLLGREGMTYVKQEMQRQFADSMLLAEEESAWEHHAWFMLRFRYVPKLYMIHFEKEFNGFNIRITKDDGAFIALAELTDVSNHMTEKDICDSIGKLKSVLESDIAFYKVINGKRYQEDKMLINETGRKAECD